MRRFKKILFVLATPIGVAIAGFAIFVGSRQHLTFDARYPEISASTDTAVVARGHYLVRTMVNCWLCHADPSRMNEAASGVDVPLSGGFHWDIPPGVFYARNITPDSTGIGNISDQAIARALRNGAGRVPWGRTRSV